MSPLVDAGVGRLLLTHHVARRLGVSSRTVRWWAQTRQLRAVRVGLRVWAYYPSDVEAFAVNRTWGKAAQ